MIKVVFVCLGNICRSPLAEGIFKKMLIEENLHNKIYADSAGTAAYHIGDQPDKRSIEIAHKYGIVLEHEGRQFSRNDLHEFDYIIAMDSKNYAGIKGLGEGKGKVVLMRDFDEHGSGKDVPDPYYGGIEGFEEVYNMAHRSCAALLEHIKKEHQF